jgi:hypothetical protein
MFVRVVYIEERWLRLIEVVDMKREVIVSVIKGMGLCMLV